MVIAKMQAYFGWAAKMLETICLNQRAVLWPFDSYGPEGELRVGAAVEISVRWSVSIASGQGDTTDSFSKNSTLSVDRTIAVGGVIRLGRKKQLPDPPDDIYEITGYEEVPDIKGRNFHRSITVRKYAGSLPEVV